MSDNYTVDILVNDKPIRKFSHEGKLFVEARKGQNYTIRIKNNCIGRILAVSSVDGLDVLSGKKASKNANGYVINGYNSLTIDGFRVSDEKVAKFEFDLKGESYAASKDDDSVKNVGVIGVRLYAEKVKVEPIVIREDHHHHHYPKEPIWPRNPWRSPWWDTGTPVYPPYTITCDTGDFKYSQTYTSTGGQHSQTFNMCASNEQLSPEKIKSSFLRCANDKNVNMAAMNNIVKSANFDMGTKFGEAKESKVVEVEFEKGLLSFSNNIYYASREALIEMGVPIGNEKQVSFPEPFVDEKYAKPPKGWQG